MLLRLVSLLLALITCQFVAGLPLTVNDIKAQVEDDGPSAWELSGQFEGDIILSESQLRNGLISQTSRWTNNTLPYLIDPIFTKEQVDQILKAVEEYGKLSCVTLRPYRAVDTPDGPKDVDYVYIQGLNTGCWSSVGRQKGKQLLNLAPSTPGEGCFRIGTVIHELLHAIGFFHQQSATERDEYVTILWENIQEGKEGNFDKYGASDITSFGVSYDYDSVMHYSELAFSKNGLRTIVPVNNNVSIGQRLGFSKKDIEKLKKMYGCST